MRLDIDNGNGNDMTNGNDRTLTSEISEINEMSTVPCCRGMTVNSRVFNLIKTLGL
jgi:hypothetical protein